MILKWSEIKKSTLYLEKEIVKQDVKDRKYKRANVKQRQRCQSKKYNKCQTLNDMEESMQKSIFPFHQRVGRAH